MYLLQSRAAVILIPIALSRPSTELRKELQSNTTLMTKMNIGLLLIKISGILKELQGKYARENTAWLRVIPCFELWLLLHFKQLNELTGLAGSTSGGRCKPATDALKVEDPSFRKGKVTNKRYYDEAETNRVIAKAKNLDRSNANRPLRTFGTRVHKLIESIRKSST